MARRTILKHFMTPKYKENPDLPLQIVVTVTGEKEYRKNCRRAEGLWFAEGVDVVKVEGKWYMPTNSKIAFDHETQSYCLRHSLTGPQLIHGIIGYNKDKDDFILGFFSKNKYNNVTVVNDNVGTLQALNTDVIDSSGYKEELATGYYRKGMRANTIKSSINHADKGYNIEENGYDRLIKLYNEKPYKVNVEHAKIAALLGTTTFGIELEACAGNMPSHLLARTGTCICKDGSLLDTENRYPPEYVTVPLSSAKGISNIVELCQYLAPRNMADLKCSYHLHLGGFRTDRLFLVALHSLGYKIQAEVFKMFPFYKLKPEGIKGKNYCKVLPKIIKQYKAGDNFEEYVANSYKELYKYLSEVDEGGRIEPSKDFNRKNMQHRGRYKWNKTARYHWLNMINSIFSPRNTIEFRLHTPTFNATKIINWLLIGNAICKFAERYPLKCIDATKITFAEVLDYYTNINSKNSYNAFISSYLQAYVKERITMFKADKKAGDHISDHELLNDKTYTFIHNDKTLL